MIGPLFGRVLARQYPVISLGLLHRLGGAQRTPAKYQEGLTAAGV